MATGTDTRESFDVNVKDFQGHSVVIKVTPTWDVARVKQEISRHTHVSPRNFKLVFAGQTLAETLTLWVGVVCMCSVLHNRSIFSCCSSSLDPDLLAWDVCLEQSGVQTTAVVYM